ncbi:MAG: oligosaccharide flippase family protein [Pseudomonadota bacterium]
MAAEAAGQGGGFRAKLVRSAQYSTLIFASQIVLKLVSITVLTRLLTPDVYGVFAIVLTYLYILQMISDIGLRSVVLTHDGELDEAFLGTCFSIAILRGVLITAASALVALLLVQLRKAGVFADDSVYAALVLPYALVAVGGVQILGGLVSPNLYVRERDMAFGRVAMTEVATGVVTLAVTVGAAVVLRSVWALVIGSATATFVRVVLSHLLFSGPKIRPRFEQNAARAVLLRGRWIASHSLLTMMAKAGDRLVLGFVLDASGFGFYYIARQFSDMGMRFLQTLHSRSGLQLFTHVLKARVEDVRRNYYRYRLVFDGLSGLAAGGLFALAPLLVGILFDDRYAPVAAMLQILCLALLLVGPLTLRAAFSSRREFGRMAWLSLVSAIVLWAGLGIAVWLDSVPMALLVIALYRLPEAALLAIAGAREGWVVWWREPLPLFSFAAGAALGYGVDWVWSVVV